MWLTKKKKKNIAKYLISVITKIFKKAVKSVFGVLAKGSCTMFFLVVPTNLRLINLFYSLTSCLVMKIKNTWLIQLSYITLLQYFFLLKFKWNVTPCIQQARKFYFFAGVCFALLDLLPCLQVLFGPILNLFIEKIFNYGPIQ